MDNQTLQELVIAHDFDVFKRFSRGLWDQRGYFDPYQECSEGQNTVPEGQNHSKTWQAKKQLYDIPTNTYDLKMEVKS